ncbi:MAG: HEPN domain-containing protein [Nanoarchaeota archaeon]|nr:HEPN domain-containing protein [Nanoarchaeota archaeon]MCK5630568.1 HEPN domain-containing protein [Nanoarchaeota archaeon]
MIPKSSKSLDNAHERCSRKRTFIQINKDSYSDYRDEALSDLDSAHKEIRGGSLKWAIVKAYQALFLQCTAALVKNLGVYSKDHGCLIIALLKNDIISKDVLEKINKMFKHKQTLYEGIDRIRLFRNKALYFPKSQSRLAKEETEKTVEEIRKLINAIGEQL